MKGKDKEIIEEMIAMKPFLIFSYQKRSIQRLTNKLISIFKNDYDIIGSDTFK